MRSPVARETRSGRRGPRRAVAVAVTLVVVLTLIGPAANEVLRRGGDAPLGVRWLLLAVLVVPGVMTVSSVAATRFSLAWASYWLWSFVFLGLAPAYQVASGVYPWLGAFDERTLRDAMVATLLGHAAVVVVSSVARRRQAKGAQRRPGTSSSTWQDTLRSPRLAGFVRWLLVSHILVGVAFVGLMGMQGLTGGRTAFRVRLLEVAELPGGGSLYFLATAAAVAVPSLAVACRRAGVATNPALLVASIVVGAVATNPLIGSRFLTGAFAVSLAGAVLLGRDAARLLPASMVVLLVTVFPSLDLFRGDGTGATRLALAPPGEALLAFDFDAFEMLARAVMVRDGADDLVDPVAMLVGPWLRWVPVASTWVVDSASGPIVARSSGMGYTNVSMPLIGEGYLLGGLLGVVVLLGLLGLWLGRLRLGGGSGPGTATTAALLDAPTAALLYIVLRGSLYEVLGYLLFVLALYGVLLVVVPRSAARTHDGTGAALVSAPAPAVAQR